MTDSPSIPRYDCNHPYTPDPKRGGACAGARGQGCDHPPSCHPAPSIPQGEPLPNDLRILSDLSEWLRNGNAYMEHPGGQEGTLDAADVLDRILGALSQERGHEPPTETQT